MAATSWRRSSAVMLSGSVVEIMARLPGPDLLDPVRGGVCLKECTCIATHGRIARIRAVAVVELEQLVGHDRVPGDAGPPDEPSHLEHPEGMLVTLLTDAQAFFVMPHVDVVLLGADAVLSDGSVVNKVGSASLALIAHRHGKPVWVTAERLKFTRPGAAYDPVSESQAAAEVWDACPSGIDIFNVYFDRVPADLITEIISADGRR